MKTGMRYLGEKELEMKRYKSLQITVAVCLMVALGISVMSCGDGGENLKATTYPYESSGSMGYIDTNGRMAIDARFDACRSFSEGLAAVEINGKYGYINKAGELVIEPLYVDGGEFHEDLAPVALNFDQYGYIDKTGKMVIEPTFCYADPFSDGLAAVLLEPEGETEFIDRSGKLVTDKALEFASEPAHTGRFSEGLAAVSVDPGQYGYIDTTGTMVIAPQPLESAGYFHEGLAIVRRDGKMGVINREGKMVVEPVFGIIYDFGDGLAPFSVQVHPAGKFGYLDRTGKVVIEPRFDLALSFSEGLAAVTFSQE